jgi:hypothetical protein
MLMVRDVRLARLAAQMAIAWLDEREAEPGEQTDEALRQLIGKFDVVLEAVGGAGAEGMVALVLPVDRLS